MDQHQVGHDYVAELHFMAELIADIRSVASSFAGAIRRKMDAEVAMLEGCLIKLTEERAFIRCDMPWWPEWKSKAAPA